MTRVGAWRDRLGRVATAAVLGSVMFMLGAAGSKNSPSLPPTIDPAVACKRPKTATPYFPAARSRDLLRAGLAPFADAPLLEESGILKVFGTAQGRLEPQGRDKDTLRTPRYLRPHHASGVVDSASPPA